MMKLSFSFQVNNVFGFKRTSDFPCKIGYKTMTSNELIGCIIIMDRNRF